VRDETCRVGGGVRDVRGRKPACITLNTCGRPAWHTAAASLLSERFACPQPHVQRMRTVRLAPPCITWKL
jgi:hypothetical protein